VICHEGEEEVGIIVNLTIGRIKTSVECSEKVRVSEGKSLSPPLTNLESCEAFVPEMTVLDLQIVQIKVPSFPAKLKEETA